MPEIVFAIVRRFFLFVLALALFPSFAAANPPNYQVDPSWLACAADADCVSVEDGTCHIAHVVNASHLDAWNNLNQDTTRRLQTAAPSDFCGKPGQMFPTLKEGYAECRNGVCVFHDLKNRVNGFSQ